MSNPIAEWAAASFSPLVAVASSEKAKLLCGAFGLSAAELFRPLCPFRLHSSVKSPTKSYNLKDFSYRTVLVEEIRESDASLFDSSVRSVLEKFNPDTSSAYYASLSSASKLSSEYQNTPWLVPILNELQRFFSQCTFNLHNQPLAFISLVTPDDESPVSLLGNQLKRKNLPTPFREEHYDTSIPSFYVLLISSPSESSSGSESLARNSSPSADSLLKEMRKQFPSSKCFVLNLSRDGSVSAIEGGPWQSVKQKSLVSASLDISVPASQVPGGGLSSESRGALNDIMKTVCSKGIVSQLQEMLIDCEEVVSHEKRGLTNTFKSWLRKPKSVRRGREISKDSVEWKTLLCAHLYLMLKDYESASECFKFSKEDWKSIGDSEGSSWCYFYLSVCQYLQKGSSKSIIHNLTSSMDQIRQSDLEERSKTLFQTYLSLYHSVIQPEVSSSADQSLSWLTRSFGNEKSVLSSVLLSQLIVQLHRHESSLQSRKVILYNVLSIHVFEEYKLYHYVIRSAHLSLLSLKDNSWWSIIDYLRTVLCNAYTSIGANTSSIPYYLQLISSSNSSRYQLYQSIVSFKQVMKNLLQGESAGGPGAVTVELPLVDESSVFVVPPFYQIQEGSDPLVDQQPSIVSYYKREKESIANGHRRFDWSRSLPDSRLEGEISACNEVLTVSVLLKNPLNLKLQVKDMKLLVNLTPAGSTGEEGSTSSKVEVLSQTIVIEPKSSKVVYLQCRPLVGGTLSITGCQWLILDYLTITYQFKGKPVGKKGDLSLSHLTCPIASSEGCLEWSDFPSCVHQNGVYAIHIDLSNSGSTHLKNIELFSVDCLHAVVQNDSPLESLGPSGSLTPLPSTLLISPDNSVSLLVYLTVVRPVSVMEFFFSYQVYEKGGNTLVTRHLIHQQKIQTLPTLQLSKVSSSALQYGSFTVKSDLLHLPGVLSFKNSLELQKLSSLGHWKLERSGEESTGAGAVSLDPGTHRNISVVAVSSESVTSSELPLSSVVSFLVPPVMERFLEKKLLGYYTLLQERKEYDRKVKGTGPQFSLLVSDAHIRGVTYRPNFAVTGIPFAYEPSFASDRQSVYLFYHWVHNKVAGVSVVHQSLSLSNDLYTVIVKPNSQDHDFFKSACLVSVSVELFWSGPGSRVVRLQSQSSPSYFWVGKTSYVLSMQSPYSGTLTFQCVLEKPGVYNMNQFEYSYLDQPQMKFSTTKEKPCTLTLRNIGGALQTQTRQRRSSTSVDQSIPDDDLLSPGLLGSVDSSNRSAGSLSSASSPTHDQGQLIELDCTTPRVPEDSGAVPSPLPN